IATAPVALDAARGQIEDSALVDAIHQVQLHYAKADVSLTALFNSKLKIAAGPVTIRDAAGLYLYENELYAIEGTGAMLKAALENAARFFNSCTEPTCSAVPLINRRFPGFNYDMAQGVEYEVDLQAPAGQRIKNLRYQGAPLADTQKLRIALNDYRAGGSGGYTMFKGAPVLWRSHREVRDLIIEYYTEHQTLPAKPDQNWRIVPEAARQRLEQELRRP
ncbi:MAG: 5'-nucleotidase C-terminal domain-containing protein, partial [Acidobacteria bacterium]|nr:5'-nucleotidase C-terminal domain-containing protein [Acidobacteriota bacterium]